MMRKAEYITFLNHSRSWFLNLILNFCFSLATCDGLAPFQTRATKPLSSNPPFLVLSFGTRYSIAKEYGDKLILAQYTQGVVLDRSFEEVAFAGQCQKHLENFLLVYVWDIAIPIEAHKNNPAMEGGVRV